MINWFYALIPIAVVLIWFYLKRAKARSSSSRKTASSTSNREEKFRAVSIQTGPRACTAAKYLKDKKFLSAQAPELPLSRCDISDCKCKYVYHKDRLMKWVALVDVQVGETIYEVPFKFETTYTFNNV